MSSFQNEIKIEKKLRRHSWFIPMLSFIAATGLFLGVVLCAKGFTEGHYWTVLVAGLLVHSFFIVLVHDGAHKAITRTKWDYVIMNAGAGLMLLPFYAEPFRKYHLIHHANTNSEVDPLWPEMKRKVFLTSRLLYLVCELVPLAFTFVLILNGEKKRTQSSKVKGPEIRWSYMIFAFVISAIVLAIVVPPLWFVVGTLLSVNIVKLVRHWCEHMGQKDNRESNTYWFPLGMGIGNHEAHHEHPNFSWVTMMIGLAFREKEMYPFKATKGVLFENDFRHYSK